MNDNQQNPNLQFIEDLIKVKGFPDLEDDIKEGLKQDLLKKLEEFLRAELIKRLDDDQVNQLSALLSKNPSVQEMTEFWQSNIEDYKAVATSIYIKFRDIYLS